MLGTARAELSGSCEIEGADEEALREDTLKY